MTKPQSNIYGTDGAKIAVVLVIGKTFEEAIKIADTHKVRHRIAKLDGKPRILTRDYRLDRINLTIVDGIIVDAKIG